MALSKEQLAAVQQHVARSAACPTTVVDRLDAFAVGLAMAVEIIGRIGNLKLEVPAEPAAEVPAVVAATKTETPASEQGEITSGD